MPYVDESPLLDVGAGAGLPGIVLSIMKPTLAVISGRNFGHNICQLDWQKK
jgi:hypothetical protein